MKESLKVLWAFDDESSKALGDYLADGWVVDSYYLLHSRILFILRKK
jgi:hypothetical protein